MKHIDGSIEITFFPVFIHDIFLIYNLEQQPQQ